jgi:uroporphyrinogen-III synthase
MSDRREVGLLSGRRIALPETREIEQLARMLEQQGAETLRCPMVAITDAPDPMPVREWLTVHRRGCPPAARLCAAL